MFVSYLIPQALQRAVPSSAFLHMGVFLVQHDAQILSSDDRGMKTFLLPATTGQERLLFV